jgi:hypothetical protein
MSLPPVDMQALPHVRRFLAHRARAWSTDILGWEALALAAVTPSERMKYRSLCSRAIRMQIMDVQEILGREDLQTLTNGYIQPDELIGDDESLDLEDRVRHWIRFAAASTGPYIHSRAGRRLLQMRIRRARYWKDVHFFVVRSNGSVRRYSPDAGYFRQRWADDSHGWGRLVNKAMRGGSSETSLITMKVRSMKYWYLHMAELAGGKEVPYDLSSTGSNPLL